jgi:hypothetical protein
MLTLRLPINIPGHIRAGTVLLVSADTDWRMAAARTLIDAGYQVIAVRHSGQALVESSRYSALDVVVAEGELGRSGLPARIFHEHPEAKVLHFPTPPRTPAELLESVSVALK